MNVGAFYITLLLYFISSSVIMFVTVKQFRSCSINSEKFADEKLLGLEFGLLNQKLSLGPNLEFIRPKFL